MPPAPPVVDPGADMEVKGPFDVGSRPASVLGVGLRPVGGHGVPGGDAANGGGPGLLADDYPADGLGPAHHLKKRRAAGKGGFEAAGWGGHGFLL